MNPVAFHQIVAEWHDFYSVLGQSAATLTGLLFVAASLGSGVFTTDRPAGLRMFLTSSVVQFGGVLAVSLVALAPIHGPRLFTVLIMVCGAIGLAYCALAWHSTIRSGMFAKIDWEDRFWYAILPVIGYLCEIGAGTMLRVAPQNGSDALAVSAGLLLLAGIHNAWDITVWSITRARP